MRKDEYIEKHITGVLARAEILRGMGVMADAPEMAKFTPRTQTNGEQRIERHVWRYYQRTGEWPRAGQVIASTRQRFEELHETIKKTGGVICLEASGDVGNRWRTVNGGRLAAHIVKLSYLEDKHEQT